MKPWLATLVAELANGNKPILALSPQKHLATAALYNHEGELLAGSLGDQAAHLLAATESKNLTAGQTAYFQDNKLLLKNLSTDDLSFWQQAQESEKGAWAAWLLSVPQNGTLAHQLIAAFGPHSVPLLPQKAEGWILTPLNSGLGRLFVLGNDATSVETAALAARAGLVVSLISTNPPQLELDEAFAWSDFEVIKITAWTDLGPDELETFGFSQGVRVIMLGITDDTLKEEIEKFKPRHLLEMADESIIPLALAAKII